ncbi:precorrin-6Y C5,15-methyltransferase (decarboxylating) subunit CbiT [Clostridium zeae]|uniref:Precorrin-6Y C5,15-methyltransferase (Decarboxylating) subunit CbiT n=1 Tax=Clostridium zeae TaxID=2759022 RepID=A0ABQ1EDB7_9CLOT|nr:precorrin-6Y C5,15-methyltransferase (decarboxylating) subunit CbiT [Clostridium zeae]GFZ32646.1 precorrin-6Y C5,15-methyltransferase (decarboxylating) subunit CbiT [Clostridium zeae]
MIYIKDEEFIRGNCPMTKEEVRIVSIAKLEIEEEYNLLDIGAGTGSVSVQMSRSVTKGKVISIEKDEEALELLHKNKEKFNAENMQIISGEALEVEPLVEGQYDGIFIGGSGGNLQDIIKVYGSKLKPNRNMVLNFITIDNLYKAVNCLRELGYEVECTQLAVSKAKGKSLMLTANNPIFIITATKK